MKGVTKKFGDVTAVDHLDLDVRDGEFFVILGPSGAGKTTTLKSVGGLVEIDEGEVFISDRNMTLVEPYRRNVAMAFESYALYPQKSVFENLASPLKSGRTGKYSAQEQKSRIEAVTTTLGIENLLQRLPKELSNGQRQRVALGRVLVRPADIYLLDEPLSHLDAKLRAAMRAELKQLGGLSNTTVLYVTHDYQEALALGDRIAVLRHGKLVQLGTPKDIWQRPVDDFVARALGQPEMDLIAAEVVDGRLKAANGAIDLTVPPGLSLSAHSHVQLGMRPRDLEVVRPGRGGQDWATFAGQVILTERVGRDVAITVQVSDTKIVALVTGAQAPAEGAHVELQMHLGDVHVFEERREGQWSLRLGSMHGPDNIANTKTREPS